MKYLGIAAVVVGLGIGSWLGYSAWHDSHCENMQRAAIHLLRAELNTGVETCDKIANEDEQTACLKELADKVEAGLAAARTELAAKGCPLPERE
jgi:predicted negative regulator of RcsB-dependent stress response